MFPSSTAQKYPHPDSPVLTRQGSSAFSYDDGKRPQTCKNDTAWTPGHVVPNIGECFGTPRQQWSHMHTNAFVYNFWFAHSSQKGSILWRFQYRSGTLIIKIKINDFVKVRYYSRELLFFYFFSVLLALRRSRWTLKNRISSGLHPPVSNFHCQPSKGSVSLSVVKEWGAFAGDGDVLCRYPTQTGPPLCPAQKKKTPQCVLWHGKHFSRGNAACGTDSRQKVLCSSLCFVIWEGWKLKETLPQHLNSIWTTVGFLAKLESQLKCALQHLLKNNLVKVKYSHYYLAAGETWDIWTDSHNRFDRGACCLSVGVAGWVGLGLWHWRVSGFRWNATKEKKKRHTAQDFCFLFFLSLPNNASL